MVWLRKIHNFKVIKDIKVEIETTIQELESFEGKVYLERSKKNLWKQARDTETWKTGG